MPSSGPLGTTHPSASSLLPAHFSSDRPTTQRCAPAGEASSCLTMWSKMISDTLTVIESYLPDAFTNVPRSPRCTAVMADCQAQAQNMISWCLRDGVNMTRCGGSCGCRRSTILYLAVRNQSLVLVMVTRLIMVTRSSLLQNYSVESARQPGVLSRRRNDDT